MTTWTLKTLDKKSAVERQFWCKDGKVVIREEGYRWGEFYCESDEQPEIDLDNASGYNLSESDYDWELTSLDDGCWADWTFPEGMTETEQAEIEAAWDDFEGMEELGWRNDDTEYILQGPLELSADDGTAIEHNVKPKSDPNPDAAVVINNAGWPFPPADPEQGD